MTIEVEVNQVPEDWFCEAEKLGTIKTKAGRVEILYGLKSKSLLFKFPDKTRWFIENREVAKKVIMAILNQEPENETTLEAMPHRNSEMAKKG